MASKDNIAVIEAYSGKIVSKKTLTGDLEEVVKEEAGRLLKEKWIPTFSDFMVLKETIDVELKLPLTTEQLNLYKKYKLRKTGPDTAVASLPIYIIVYESLKLSEDEYHDRGVAAVTVFGREEDLEQIEDLLVQTTMKPSMEQGEKTSEKLLSEEPIPEEETGRKKKKTGKKKKK